MVNVVEEVCEPQRNMPIAIMLALGFASLLYVLIALAAVLSLSPDELNTSDSPMVSLLATKNQHLTTTIGIVSLVAILNGALIQIIMGTRLLYGMSTQQLAPHCLGIISKKTQTPIIATLLIGVIIWILAIALPLVTLARVTSSIILVVFTLVNASLVIIKFRETGSILALDKRTYLAAIGCFLCLSLLLLQILPYTR